MYKEFYLNNQKAMINFTTKYCDTAEKLFNSNGFREVLKAYLNRIEKKESNIYKYIRFRKE